MAEMVEVDKGQLFAVIRAAQSFVVYLRDPDGYADEGTMAAGCAQADFIEEAIDSLIPEL